MPSEITVSQPRVVRAAESLTGAPIRFVGKETLVKLAAGDAANPISVLEDMQCISVKQGPFLGTENDKVFVEVAQR